MTERRNGTYASNAALHPANLLALLGVTFLGLILSSWTMMLAGLGAEAVFLVVVPRLTPFQRAVDACIDEAERAVAKKAHEALVAQMSDAHRQEFATLEALAAKTFANAERRHGPNLWGRAGERDGVAQLLGSYVRLAIAHRACEESTSTTSRHLLVAKIRALEAAEATQPQARRALTQRRLSIARRRDECWSRTREDMDLLEQQISTIVELVQLMHQESLTSAGPASLSSEIDRIVADFEEGERALREVDALGALGIGSRPDDAGYSDDGHDDHGHDDHGPCPAAHDDLAARRSVAG